MSGGRREAILQAPAADVQATIVQRSLSTEFEQQDDVAYTYTNGKLTYRVLDEHQRPITRARVTVDGKTRLTDGNGYVQFTLAPGDYMLRIEAPGYIEQLVTVTL
jgi:uncharacterized membrane protein